MQNRSSSNVTFIDVSHWEGNIDWNAVKASGIRQRMQKRQKV